MSHAAPYADCSTFDTWRTLLTADRSAPFTLRPALNSFHFIFNTCHPTPNKDCSLLYAWLPVLITECRLFSPSALRAKPVSLRAQCFALAPYANCFACDTWRSLLPVDCSTLFTLRPALDSDCSMSNP